MPLIHLITEIHAPIERCFDLSRSIDLHMITTKKTKEKAIAGRMTGLVEEGDTVTWEATHFGIKQQLGSKITSVKRPVYFADEQIHGAFKRFHHDHMFEEKAGITIMTDQFDYTSPLGILGKFADFLFLKRYLAKFIKERNQFIKVYAETDKWKEIIRES
jgi:ligand-binding SRPBCC domain-containing protein